MSHWHVPRPSPAMVVAMLALFVALGGTVYAASSFSGKTIRKGSLPGNRLKNNTVTGRQVNEATLGKVPSAASAEVAAKALSANPVAYAHIYGDGTVDSRDALNLTNANVILANLGTYCLVGLPEAHVVLAEVDSGDTPGVTETSVFPGSFSKCPARADAEIVTYLPSNAGRSDFEEGFYVVVF